ncbi:MAG: FHA domain-containing protein [Polyangiaceae bacterium]
MGSLADQARSRRVTLGARCLVGRGPQCALRIDDPKVSSEHARLRYKSGAWYVRDLGSSNGTQVDDTPLMPGRERRLESGARLCFGSRDVEWQLVDDASPAVAARHADGRRVTLADGILCLPDTDDPACQIFVDTHGDWVAESVDGAMVVVDQQAIEVEGERWCLELPPPDDSIESTFRASEGAPRTLARLRLRFTVSHDGEDVSLALEHGDWRADLGIRVYNELLLVLARHRLRDAAEHPELDEAEHGWVYTDDFCREVNLRDGSHLNQHAFQARRQLARLDIEASAKLVDRGRPGRIRLGTARVAIEGD